MEKLNPLRTGGATALAAAVLNMVCAAVVYLFPGAMIDFVNAWMHGLNLSVLASDKPFTLGGLVFGLFNVSLSGFLVGALFACYYNLVGSSPKNPPR